MIRVVVADDHHYVRAAVQTLLRHARDIELVGEATNGEEAVDCVKQLHPDVIIMDISMPGMDGIEATEAIQSLETDSQVLIISMYGDTTLINRALSAGARGYVHKKDLSDRLLPAIKAVAEGEGFFVTK